MHLGCGPGDPTLNVRPFGKFADVARPMEEGGKSLAVWVSVVGQKSRWEEAGPGCRGHCRTNLELQSSNPSSQWLPL